MEQGQKQSRLSWLNHFEIHNIDEALYKNDLL